MSIPTTLGSIRDELNAKFYERKDTVEALFLAALAREHAFILGPPGTAKSELTREFVGRFPGALYFEQLLSKNRPDQAVLGPYDLPLLRDEGEFRRKDAGYLTTVHFAFLDEAGKMSPTLGHDLLAAANERIKHEVSNGRSSSTIPLHTLFAASNEHPASESEDAAALWDRLLVRSVVDYIQDNGSFKGLLERSDAVVQATTLPYEDLVTAVEETGRVVLMDDVLDGVVEIRKALAKDGMTVSDRRWRASMKVVRAHAYMAGRNVADLEDLTALRFTLWEDQEQIRKVERLILSVASPDAEEAIAMLDSLAEFRAGLKAKSDVSEEKSVQYLSEVMGKLQVIEKQATKLRAKIVKNGRATDRIDSVLEGVGSLRKEGMILLRITSPDE